MNGYENLKVVIKAFVCDAPARAFLKCVKGHSGYDSCERQISVTSTINTEMFLTLSYLVIYQILLRFYFCCKQLFLSE